MFVSTFAATKYALFHTHECVGGIDILELEQATAAAAPGGGRWFYGPAHGNAFQLKLAVKLEPRM
ncbi:MAG: hypothetical protein KGQ46_03095 [Hyphomicrobiales bacterium]|nr:hypothetical protein [Hyphomicrobiales bacterium]MDE2115404.1 hypothetical protein [Hyphomicrobiales bacterium]